MKKNKDTSLIVTNLKTSEAQVFSTVQQAAKELNLTERSLIIRATKESVIKNIKYQWQNPSTKRSYLGRKSRRKGNHWELEIINALKEAGYDGCVSSRSESKRMDDAKIDIVDTKNELPCYIQAKNTKSLPNYHKIFESCPKKDKPFVIACKQEGKHPPIVMMPIDFFYSLINKK